MKREASPFKYDELLAVAAGDWGAFKDEGGWMARLIVVVAVW